jgi:Glycosyl transferase 4-like
MVGSSAFADNGSSPNTTDRLRVMYVLKNYPQMSETYIKSEIEAVSDQCEVGIVATKEANLPARNHLAFQYIEDVAAIREQIEEFQPDVLHGHWLHSVKMIGQLSRRTKIPFTVRAHSFDSLWSRKNPALDLLPIFRSYRFPSHVRRGLSFINDDLCLGILAFPFTRARLEKAGIRAEKIIDSYPVVNYRLFHDRSANGDAIMNVGACIPKKKMEDFVELGMRAPQLRFNLYALGYDVDQLRQLSLAKGSPVNFIPPIELEDMPAEYKKHRWLVYTAARGGRVGWPMAIAEAQASGVGVCMANIRPDLREYVGPAGFLYDSLTEVERLISQPFPEELRQLGFEHAKKSDIFTHRASLFELWNKSSSFHSKRSLRKQSRSAGSP